MPKNGIGGLELTIIGSSAHDPSQFPEIAAFVKRHNVPLASIVSHQFPLEDGPEAFRIDADANTGKVCFRFE